jgi:hypothetical protein
MYFKSSKQDYYSRLNTLCHFLRVTKPKGLNNRGNSIYYHLFFPRIEVLGYYLVPKTSIPGFKIMKMKKLEMIKIRGGISWIIPILPLPREFKLKTIDNVKQNLKKLLEKEGSFVEVLNPSFELYDTPLGLMKISGDIQGDVYYHTANPPIHKGCASWPGYFRVTLVSPDEKYNPLKKSLARVLHPIRSVIFGF